MTNVVPFARKLDACPTCGHVDLGDRGSRNRWRLFRYGMERMALRFLAFVTVVFALLYTAFGIVIILAIPYGGVGWAIGAGAILLIMLRLLRWAVVQGFRLPNAIFEHHHYAGRR